MESGLLDLDFQNSLAVKKMFEGTGWKLFEEKLQNLLMYEKCQLEKLQLTVITEDKLPILNKHLCYIHILEQILDLKQELLEDIEYSPAEEGVHNTSQE